MAATIGDVARVAGVSRSTVSYALSGKRAISEETRTRIQEAIEQLGFTPNAGARALATSQTNVLGLYLQFEEDEFAPAMLQYVLPVSTTARDHGYDLLMVTDPDLVNAVRRTTSSMNSGWCASKCAIVRSASNALSSAYRTRNVSLTGHLQWLAASARST